ncbi:MAG: hypothetical protein IPP72_13005 [Chitinophagaceae bacterium]|nr:hypothetical protein [Chitinophagaceae bacterium]
MRAAKDAWYKNRAWNGKIDSNFEDGLKRTRNNASKAEYLQVQGCYLLNSPQAKIREVGINLLSRLFSDHPSEYVSVLTAQEKLGDHYLAQKDYLHAAACFKIVTDHCSKQNSRTGTSNMADLKWAEAILKSNQSGEMEAAYQLVMQYPKALLKLNDSKFYYAELAAHICQRLDRKEEADSFAAAAAALLNTTNHLVSRFKK